jgi:DNA-binding response OmpR family regulator
MGKKRQILAVDDNSISLATIEQELDWEFDVIPLNSGIRALQYLKKEEQKPDLILLDIQMAIKDGIETLKEIRQIKDCQDIPVIMLTSNANKKMVVESSKFKIYDYVLKPFKKRELCERIDIVLHKVSEEKEKGSFLHETRSLLEIEQGTKK